MDFPKKGKFSKQVKKHRKIKCDDSSTMYDPPNIGRVPPSERTFFKNQYAKTPKDRRKQGEGDLNKELRTDTYIYGTYLRSK